MSAPILVTGGAGFIGSHLVRLLLEQGHSVRVLERRAASVAHLPVERLEIVRGDVRDWHGVMDAVRGCRAVYHLAADPQLWAQPRGRFHQINYRGAVHVLDAALLAGVERIVHVSSESLLARTARNGSAPEEQAISLNDVVGPYGRSKFRAERYGFQLARRGAPVIIVNPTLPIGPGDLGRSPPTQMLLDFCRGGRQEYLDTELNLIDVRDVAEGMIRAMAVGVPGRRYVLGGETLPLRELFTRLAKMTGLPPPHRRIPYPVALAAAYVSEFVADVFTHRPPAATVSGVKLARRKQACDPRRSLAELGLRPRPLADSLRDTLAWYRHVGWVSIARH